MSTYIPLFKHQEATANFIATHPRVLDMSDPGTGKTRSRLEGYRRNYHGKHLVVAPLSILRPAWGDDTAKFTGFEYAIAHGSPTKRLAALQANVHIVLINPDGLVWLADMVKKGVVSLKDFTDITIDEFTAFKNRTSKRSKAIGYLINHFKNRVALSGTPNPKSVLDLWYPAFLVDGGQRLGRNFFHFRSQVCIPKQIGPRPDMVKWVDKPEALMMVSNALADITIRHKLEECIDMPEHIETMLMVDMPRDIMVKYQILESTARLSLDEGALTAMHAGVKVQKMLQLLSGAVYDNEGKILKVHKDRYDLVMDLVEERAQCLVAFNWSHEKDCMTELAAERGFTYGVIDGSTPMTQRGEIVDLFQKGELKLIFAHPQSAGHGLTLTKGTTTIWPSPTYNAEHFQQFNRRIYRAGQKLRTETICIAARGTKEEHVYEILSGKRQQMNDLLGIFNALTKGV